MKRLVLSTLLALVLMAGCKSPNAKLQQALMDDDVEAVKAAISSGADPFSGEGYSDQMSPIMKAAAHSWSEDIGLLQAAGVDFEKPDVFGFKAIHYAASLAQSSVLLALLKAGADPNAPLPARDTTAGSPPIPVSGEPGDSPLIMVVRRGAVSRSAVQCVEFLLAHGAKVDMRDSKGRTALWHLEGKLTPAQEKSISAETRQVRSLLIKAGADPNPRDATNQTAQQFHRAERLKEENWQRRIKRQAG